MKNLIKNKLLFIAFIVLLFALYLVDCGGRIGDDDDMDGSSADDDIADDDSTSDDDDDDDDDDSTIEGCGDSLWEFVDERFDLEDIVYVLAKYSGNSSDGTKERPFNTIREGLKAARDFGYQAVAVSDGDYSEKLDLEALVGSSGEMRIIGRCPELVKIDKDLDKVVELNVPKIEFSYFTVVGHGSCAVCVSAESNTVSHNYIVKGKGGETGIRVINGSGFVSENEIADFSKHQILASETTGQLLIVDNKISSSVTKPSYGIVVDNSTGVQVSRNIISDLTGYGIFIQRQSDVGVSTNTIADVSEVGVQFIESKGSIFQNSISWTKSPKSSFLFGDGIVTYNSEDVEIDGNEIQNVARAGVIVDFTEGMIERNKLITNIFGLVIQNRSNVQVDDNTLTGNDYDQFSFPVRLLEINDQSIQF